MKKLVPQFVYGQSPVGLVYSEVYKDHHIFVMSMKHSPCGYVKVEKGEKLFNVEWHDDNFNEIYKDGYVPNGGFTFSEAHLPNVPEDPDEWYMGWDYGHCWDYCVYADGFRIEGKRWTTEEIVEEAKQVIDSLIAGKNN